MSLPPLFTPLEPPLRETHMRLRWRARYGDAVDGDMSVVCSKCGSGLAGDEPAIHIHCLWCFRDLYAAGEIEGAIPA